MPLIWDVSHLYTPIVRVLNQKSTIIISTFLLQSISSIKTLKNRVAFSQNLSPAGVFVLWETFDVW